MRAESVYDVLLDLKQNEMEKLFEMIQKPMPKCHKSIWIQGWKGLSNYLDGASYQTLVTWEKEGLLKKYRLGKKVFFKREEVDNALIPVER